jgi:hypothetical protein
LLNGVLLLNAKTNSFESVSLVGAVGIETQSKFFGLIVLPASWRP